MNNIIIVDWTTSMIHFFCCWEVGRRGCWVLEMFTVGYFEKEKLKAACVNCTIPLKGQLLNTVTCSYWTDSDKRCIKLIFSTNY